MYILYYTSMVLGAGWAVRCFFSFLGPHPRHREVPRLGVQLELQLPAYTTATATRDPSLIYDLHQRSCQRQILNPPSEIRDQIHILMDTNQVHYH